MEQRNSEEIPLESELNLAEAVPRHHEPPVRRWHNGQLVDRT